MAEKIGKGFKIFVLDDEKDICYFVKEFYVKRGFEVETAQTAKKAINIIKKTKPDIALLDIRLTKGDMNGIDVLKYLRETQPECCCIMVTYMDDQNIVNQAKEIGAFDYLVKPLTLSKLENVVNKIVKKLRKGAK